MPLTLQERLLLWQRSHDVYHALKLRARAAGKYLGYALEDLRGLAEHHLAGAVCPYCHGPLTAATLAIGHKAPLTRGGRFTFKNLDISCDDCGAIKGPLDSQEYRELWQLLQTWPKPVRNHFLTCLRAGAAAVPAKLPSVGSLEWFTGSSEPHAPAPLRPLGQ